MVPSVCKFLGMVDAVMDKTAYIRFVITVQAIRVNNAIRHDFLFRHQSIRLGIIYDNGIDPSVAFQNAEGNHFSCRTATTSTFTQSAEIAFVQLDRPLKNLIGDQGQMMANDHTEFTIGLDGGVGLNVQKIGSGTGSNLEYKNLSSFF